MRSALSQLAITFCVLSLGAVGGANATLPELHRQMVGALHLMDDATFARLVALAQTAPGPNVIVMSLMGWHVAGAAGLCVATVAMIAPSSLIAFGAERSLRRFSASRAILILKSALAPIAVGLMCASGLILARAADSGGLTIALTGGMTLLSGLTRINPLYGIAAGAILGLATQRLGLSI
ncbi:chromate transporter [Methylocella tundrae]|uniref:Chromate transporter n=1 Tax=Methylocella tundrae TaxID=227605 RepID=A0A4U8YXD3_METTU|nr:chromate transporter [Methylocella tundrae]WPP05574.1 chromate transporter [Methylocella tundrae]VFU08016.1 Chromate transporter [Methylocella tundrae]